MAIVMLLWSPFLAKIKFCRRTPEILVHVPTAELLFLETHTNNQFANEPEGLYDTFETTVGKLSTRRIQICPVYFCLGVILKVILNNFQNNA